MKHDNKTLLIDIETAPNLSYTWGKWEQDVISFKENWYILSFAYKWLGENKTYVVSLPNFKLYEKDKKNDIELCRQLWRLFDEAEIIVAHNGDRFDIKKSNTRFITHGFNPPTPYKTIDTRTEARKYFRFDSNKLDDLGQYLNIGRKLNTGGFDLWLGCMSGDKKSWDKMCQYNKNDVILLEKVYLKLRGWIKQHPNMNLLLGSLSGCPNCGRNNLVRRGYAFTRTSKRQRYVCKDCGAWSQGKLEKEEGIIIR